MPFSLGGPIDPPDLLTVVAQAFEVLRKKQARSPGKGGKKLEAARRVLAELYPDGVPDQATLPNKALCTAVAKQLPFRIGNNTILRAAHRK
jgi:hypothetical protein